MNGCGSTRSDFVQWVCKYKFVEAEPPVVWAGCRLPSFREEAGEQLIAVGNGSWRGMATDDPLSCEKEQGASLKAMRCQQEVDGWDGVRWLGACGASCDSIALTPIARRDDQSTRSVSLSEAIT